MPLYDVCHLEDLPLHAAPTDARIAIRSLLRAARSPKGTALWQLTDDDLRDLHNIRGHLGSAAVFAVIGYPT